MVKPMMKLLSTALAIVFTVAVNVSFVPTVSAKEEKKTCVQGEKWDKRQKKCVENSY